MKYVLAALRLWALFVLGVHLLAYNLSPETLETFWSVWPYTFLPAWLGWPLAIGVASLVVPAWNQNVQRLISRFWQMIPGKNCLQGWFLFLALCAMPIFWLARIRHLQWGDADILVIGLSQAEPVIYNWQAPFTVYLHQRLWALVVNPLFGWGVDRVYALVSVLCGGLFVYILLKLAYELGRNTLERTLIAGFVLTSGAIQLFFGYVENYTMISLWLLIFIWLGFRSIQGVASLWSVALVLAMTNALHPSTIVIWPAVLYLAWHHYRSGEAGNQVLLSLILPPLIVSNSLITLMELGDHGLVAFLGDDRPGGGDHIWFVPHLAVRTQWERYTMFSLPHFLDWANEHFLISVFGVVTLLIAAGWAGWGSSWRSNWARQNREERSLFLAETRHQIWFLGLASGFYLFLTWVWNADYGIRKDWDLFSPSAFVYSLLAALLLIHILRDKALLAQATLLILAVSSLHTATWIFANTHRLNLS